MRETLSSATDSIQPRPLELLAPARDAGIGRQAILHGADAVYIGPELFGARRAASNSTEEIRELAEFAHIYGARVYATVNTILYDDELRRAEKLITDLYRAGVDAIIVQDLAILRLDLPPIALHASTQCDTRTAAKALYLQNLGFSQIVLARELGLGEISDIAHSVDVPVEVFVHGALCVSYSGRCHAGQQWKGRSANRGECPQVCRLPYTLEDASGRVLARKKYLLSMRDLNLSESLAELVDAGASSFKIEGRLKDAAYVKNITAYYSMLLDRIVAESSGKYRRASYGRVSVAFSPDPVKSFNRGFTDYFLHSRKPRHIASLLTPKSSGEIIKDLRMLHNGDGISYFNDKGEYEGALVNGIRGGRIQTSTRRVIPERAELHRTSDVVWDAMMAKETATRRIAVDISIDSTGATATDERGCRIRIPFRPGDEKAKGEARMRDYLSKMGATPYYLREFSSSLPDDVFIPASRLSALRRQICAALDLNATVCHRFERRRAETIDAAPDNRRLDYRDNIANSLAQRVASDHGAVVAERALETQKKDSTERVVMTCRHCVLRELGLCLKERGRELHLPVRMYSDGVEYKLRFDCGRCEMQVVASGRKSAL